MNKLTLDINNNLRHVTGCYVTKSGKPRRFDFVSATVILEAPDKDGKVHKEYHNAALESNRWNTIAKCACSESTVILSGDLVEKNGKDGKPRVVTQKDGYEYVRKDLSREWTIFDIRNDSNGAKIAFKLGARLPQANELPHEIHDDPTALALLESSDTTPSAPTEKDDEETEAPADPSEGNGAE